MTCRDNFCSSRYPERPLQNPADPELGARCRPPATAADRKNYSQANILTENTAIELVSIIPGGNREEMTSWLGPLAYATQVDVISAGDCRRHLSTPLRGADKAVWSAAISRTSVPPCWPSLYRPANRQVVIGPAGTAAITWWASMPTPPTADPLLFEGIVWSTPEVFAITSGAGGCGFCPPSAVLHDIDTPEDLTFARAQGLL